MRLLFFVALSFLALAAQVCSGRPQVDEGKADLEWIQADAITTESIKDASSENDTQVTVIDTLRDISKTLKEKFIILGDKIKEKMNQLKQAAGDQAQKIKSQLNDLRKQLKDSVQALKKKVQGFFDKGQYASFGEHAIEVFGKIVEIRDKLNEFIKGVKDVTGDKLRQMQELAKQLRQQIKMKVQELLHGSSDSQTAVYYANDDDDVDDSEAYVIATLKDISKSLKEKFLLLVEHLKEKFAELKKAGSEHAEKIKGELQILMEQVADAREAMKQKVQELFKPALYASFGEHAMEIFAKLGKLREKLNKFLEDVKKVTGEKVEMLRKLIKETREEIKKKIQELIQGSSDTQMVFYHVSDDDTDEDNDAYVIETLKDISKTLKEKFLILVENLKQKFGELKKVGDQHAENIKAQIRALKERVSDARDALKQKVQELFKPAEYASFGEHALEIFAKLENLREKLNKFLEDVKKVTGEKVDKLRELIKETRQEIKTKIQELIENSSSATTALYQASDDDEDAEAYIIDTLKDISKALKEKFLVLGERIAQKVQDIKQAFGQRAEVLKKQLQELKGQLRQASYALKKKVLEMIRPEQSAQYGMFDGISSAVSENLATLRTRLEKFLNKVQQLAGEKWVKMQETIRDLRNEIKQSIRKLLQGKAEVESTGAPELTSAIPMQY
ncbi:probable DNA double-strand break repair Rad50 ATPase [Ixodes scapularis]|nr:probable DNA double-strand break repair Rad50 ATPase [Ixodes scapularis]